MSGHRRAASAWLGEQSDSTVGLTHRWIIKGIYAAGLWMVVLGILSVLPAIDRIRVLGGSADFQERPVAALGKC